MPGVPTFGGLPGVAMAAEHKFNHLLPQQQLQQPQSQPQTQVPQVQSINMNIPYGNRMIISNDLADSTTSANSNPLVPNSPWPHGPIGITSPTPIVDQKPVQQPQSRSTVSSSFGDRNSGSPDPIPSTPLASSVSPAGNTKEHRRRITNASQAEFLTVTCNEVPLDNLNDIVSSGLSQEEQCQLLESILNRCRSYIKSITGLPLQTKGHLPLQWRYSDPACLRERNIVQRLLQQGILPSEKFCRDALKSFRESFCPSGYVSEKVTFEHLLEFRPTLLLLYITLGTRDNLEHMELLKYYLDEHIAYVAFERGDLSSEMIIALAEMLYFLGYQTYLYKFHHLLRPYLASIMVVDYSLEPGCVLGDNTAHKRWEVRAVLGSNAMTTCVGLMLPKFRTVPWSSRHLEYAKLLREQAVDPCDYYLERMAAVAQLSMDVIRALDSISDPSFVEGGCLSPIPKDILLNLVSPLEMAFEREAEQLRKDAKNGLLHMEHVSILESLHSRSHLYLYETALLRVTPKTRSNNVLVYYLGRQIQVAMTLISRFESYSKCQNMRFPVLISFVPLHALVSLSKAQILRNVVGANFKVDLPGNLKTLSESWTRMINAHPSSKCLQYAYEKVVSSVQKILESGENFTPLSDDDISQSFDKKSNGVSGLYWTTTDDSYPGYDDLVSVYLHSLGDRALDFGERS